MLRTKQWEEADLTKSGERGLKVNGRKEQKLWDRRERSVFKEQWKLLSENKIPMLRIGESSIISLQLGNYVLNQDPLKFPDFTFKNHAKFAF